MKVEQLFGKVLKDLRNKKGISQEDLADLANLDRTYISLLERGLRQPTISTLFNIAEALDTSPTEIIAKVQKLNEDSQ